MICFVILHYQAMDETIECVKSIKENVTGEKRIIIIDNASPNHTGEMLRKMYTGDEELLVKILENNFGFAKGNNIGYMHAKQYDPEFIVVLNSDTLLTKNDFKEELDNAYYKYHFDVLGPDLYSTKTRSHQNPQRDKNCTLKELKQKRRKLFLKNKFRFLLKLKYIFVQSSVESNSVNCDYNTIQIGVVLHGAFYVFSSRFIQKHNQCFYNETFMYFESYILHYLGMRERMIFLYYPQIKIIHHEDVSTNMTYKNQYNKSCFVNRCLFDSCVKFIEVMQNSTEKIG